MRKFPRLRKAVWPVSIAVAASVALIASASSYAQEETMPTVVSLTFDDGVKNHLTEAAPLLNARGMKGTFYVNSGRVGAAGFLSQDDLEALVAQGHEIGGHTTDHVDLPTLVTDDQKREICDDRVNLIQRGFQVKSLAYPYGDADGTTQAVAAKCGYNSARTVGGIVSPNTCATCPKSEKMPAQNAFMTRASDSIKDTTTLAELKSYVTNAEQDGGGWVQLVLHHVCANVCGGTYTISPTLFGQFLDWLNARKGSGTVVRTVDEVVGGNAQPGVNGPKLPTQPGNLVVNPSLEAVGAVSTPSCFQKGGFGTNSVVWSRVTGGHTGSYAQQVQVTSYTSGDRKLITHQAEAACAPEVTPGRTYRAQVWHKGSWGPTTSVRMVLYYKDAEGAWKYWRTGPVRADGQTWSMAELVSPAVPAGATALSFGLALTGLGTVITDDYHLAEVGGAA
ncbi:hypothetical protein GCM10010124_13490 [Pilimelia terevasa]|uniref:NodB homology domain-containing protein n=1 Tax=Pilimelia terevasa TaxID=53372 RepID=A0A8J3FGJ5_9ACTN|nr:polysaccharide deacetylase family protein [Pilimelia terevasa]GGK22315.1 hypothetical protein GCM10010124_13490 [Pilimelia terevasa]